MMVDENVVEDNEDQLVGHLRDALPFIDRNLAIREVALKDRIFQAATEYVRGFIKEVREGDREPAPPGVTSEFIATRWFAVVYFHVDGWYRDRYRAGFDRKSEKYIKGVVEIAETPFAIHVPITRRRPGKSGETVWVSFPDGVRDDEFPVEWIEAGPNIEKLNEEDRGPAITEASYVADKLRYIRTSLMAVPDADEKLRGLMAGILPRLENAAVLLLREQDASVQHAYWEIHLSCEHALKALRQQQAGSFRETHDLFTLFDDTEPTPAFAREILRRMPRWHDTAAMRYGIGDWRGRRQCLGTYRDGLTIIAGTVRNLRKYGIGQAEFEIARPPWFEFLDEA